MVNREKEDSIRFINAAWQGLQANNIARISVLLSEKLGQETNGITVSRYCASGLDAAELAQTLPPSTRLQPCPA